MSHRHEDAHQKCNALRAAWFVNAAATMARVWTGLGGDDYNRSAMLVVFVSLGGSLVADQTNGPEQVNPHGDPVVVLPVGVWGDYMSGGPYYDYSGEKISAAKETLHAALADDGIGGCPYFDNKTQTCKPQW